jgi:hypothetical protein
MDRIRGYVTQQKFVAGRTLEEIEKILGYQKGRLAAGISYAKLLRKPLPSEFELVGMSQVPEHKHRMPDGLNIAKIKELAMSSWSITGSDSLIKIMPATPHNLHLALDLQYPPGWGCHQWKLVSDVPALIHLVAATYPHGRFVPIQ